MVATTVGILPATVLVLSFYSTVALRPKPLQQQSNAPLPVKEDRHLQQSSCSKLQHEVQKAIIGHKWGLDNLKFQQRLKRHPKYIVTIQHIKSLHEPIIELRCPTSSSLTPLTPNSSGGDNLEFLFHESRFNAESVRLFDIHSIFPIHSGSLSIKLKLDNLIVTMDRGSDIGVGIKDMYFQTYTESYGKEHREQQDNLVDLEKEIETVFTRRIQPDVQGQIKKLLATTLKKYFDSNLVRF